MEAEICTKCELCGSDKIAEGLEIRNYRQLQSEMPQGIMEGQWCVCQRCGHRWFIQAEAERT